MALLRAAGMAFLLVIGPFGAAPAWAGDDLLATAQAIHQRIVTIDSHKDIPLDFATPDLDTGSYQRFQQWDLEQARIGGLDASFLVVYTTQRPRTATHYRLARLEALTRLDAIHRLLRVSSDRAELALTADDIRRIEGEGRHAILIGIENGFGLGTDLAELDHFFARGARYISLTHNGHNDLADAAVHRPELGDEMSEHGGLSDLGRALVARANDLGMMLDMAHAAEATVMQVAALSRAPILSTHHGLKAFADIPRNFADAEVEAVAATGGVVQLVALESFIRPPSDEQRAAFRALFEEYGIFGFLQVRDLPAEKRDDWLAAKADLDRRFGRVTVADFVDTIDHVVALVGIDHAGISSDFEGGGGIEGWDNAAESLNVTLELVRRGYSEEEIAKLWGGNLMRVMEAVEAAAR